MNSKVLFYIIVALCVIAVWVGIYYDVGVGFLSIPWIVVILVAFNNIYLDAKGTRKDKFIRLVTTIATFCMVVGSLSWILDSVSQDYLGKSFFDIWYATAGLTKIFLLILYMIVCGLAWIYKDKIADSILEGFTRIYYSSSKIKRANISYFLVLYFSTILIFSIAYDIVYKLDPEAFRIATEISPKFLDFLYFSIVTSTSYGTDLISPISLLVRGLVVIQLMISIVMLMIYISHVMSLPNE
jgi:hypothetical protein